MKIAICFSGHLRNFFNNEYQSLKDNLINLINNGHQVDCFFSIWDTYDTYYAHRGSSNHDNVNLHQLKDQLKFLNLKELEIEKFEDVKHNFYLRNFHPTIEAELPQIISSDGILYSTPMFYKIYKCNLLKKNYELKHKFQYDIVVRYRSNIKLIDSLEVIHVTSDTMYNSGHGNPSQRGLGYTHESLMTQDMFFYGPSHIMDIVCDLYLNLSKIIEAHGSTGPERLLYDWCFLENKLNHEISPIKFEYCV